MSWLGLSHTNTHHEDGAMLTASQSQKYHLENPYWATFNPYVEPLLAKPIEILRHEELDTSKDVEVV
jgi:hypothetical protein